MTEQGVKFDAAKLPLDLIPDEALAALAEVLRFGAQKYAPRNWEKGLSSARVLAAAERHFMARRAGQVSDPETGLNHLAHALCEVMFALVFDMRGQSDLPLTPRHAGHVAVLKALEVQAPRGEASHPLTEAAITAPARILVQDLTVEHDGLEFRVVHAEPPYGGWHYPVRGTVVCFIADAQDRALDTQRDAYFGSAHGWLGPDSVLELVSP